MAESVSLALRKVEQQLRRLLRPRHPPQCPPGLPYLSSTMPKKSQHYLPKAPLQLKYFIPESPATHESAFQRPRRTETELRKSAWALAGLPGSDSAKWPQRGKKGLTSISQNLQEECQHRPWKRQQPSEGSEKHPAQKRWQASSLLPACRSSS